MEGAGARTAADEAGTLGDGWLERQMGILTISGRPIVVALASTGPGHEADTLILSRLAKWVATHVDAGGAPMRPSC